MMNDSSSRKLFAHVAVDGKTGGKYRILCEQKLTRAEVRAQIAYAISKGMKPPKKGYVIEWETQFLILQ